MKVHRIASGSWPIWSLVSFLSFFAALTEELEACNHPVYCLGGPGTILHSVQLAHLFNDSKTFVDLPLLTTHQTALEDFKRLQDEKGPDLTPHQLKVFLEEHFDTSAQTGLIEWIPSDWSASIPLFSVGKIRDPDYLRLAKAVHAKWKELGRQTDGRTVDQPLEKPKRIVDTSLLSLPNGFIVPGGRFREMYYWDTYWTVKGLLISQMQRTVEGMLINFSHLISKFGMIPNGNRIYYTARSQPPLFIPMVWEYFQATQDSALVRQLLPAMEKEFSFWIENRTVEKNDRLLARYHSPVNVPRPESYAEDYTNAQDYFSEDSARQKFYTNIASAAESGWDFSSRWFRADFKGGKLFRDGLKQTDTANVAPVDLNSILCQNAKLLEQMIHSLGSTVRTSKTIEYYSRMHDEFRQTLFDLFWDEAAGVWFDYDLKLGQRRKVFYPSNISPLWNLAGSQSHIKCYHEGFDVRRLVSYFRDKGALGKPGGIPTSLVNTGQQWDYSNAWAPLQHMVIFSLDTFIQHNPGHEDLEPIVTELASKWVHNNYKGFVDSDGFMFEKYNALHPGVPPGHGDGEYQLQNGFGWTNGVLLDILNRFGNEVSTQDEILTFHVRSNQYQLAVVVLVTLAVSVIVYKRCSRKRATDFVFKDLKIHRMMVGASPRKQFA